jgi:hypothetical protein
MKDTVLSKGDFRSLVVLLSIAILPGIIYSFFPTMGRLLEVGGALLLAAWTIITLLRVCITVCKTNFSKAGFLIASLLSWPVLIVFDGGLGDYVRLAVQIPIYTKFFTSTPAPLTRFDWGFQGISGEGIRRTLVFGPSPVASIDAKPNSTEQQCPKRVDHLIGGYYLVEEGLFNC